MEGDTGAGGASHRVAAILQGLEESGVVLTMPGRQRDNHYRRDSLTSKPTFSGANPVVLERCSVETNTDFTVSNNSNRGVQISDDRYTSCYQVAHCSVRPSSPPVTVSEFPPQRSNPSYFDGNFEVGGSGSCDRRESYSRSNRIRRLTTPDRRSVNRIPSRDAEAFAHSLRKYPSFPILRTVSSEVVAKLQRSFTRKHAILSSNRTPSGELVERILRQTQAKLSPVQKTNSNRSLQYRTLQERSKWKQPRQIQAHAKTQDVLDDRRVDRPRTGRREDEINARKHMRNDDAQRLNRRKCKSRTESLLNTTYDYLKPTQPSRSCHVRRFDREPRIDEISKHVRSALREIYNQRSVVFPMCSKVQRRYDEHKKHCSGRGVDARMSNHRQKIASASGLYRLLELLSGYLSPGSCNISKLSNSSEEQLFSNRDRASQYFHDDTGCRCGSDPTDPNRVDSTCNCRPPYGEEYSRYNIQEEIHAWLSEIPVRSNEDTEDKLRREDLVRNLVKTLETLLYDDNFEENVINAITQCVDKMPMWNSGSRPKKDQLKEHLTQSLLDRLIPKPENKLSETIKKFLENLNFKHEIDTKRVADEISDTLQSLIVPETNEQHKFSIFELEIYKILEKLPIKVNGDKRENLNDLARNLANEMIELLKNISDSSKPNSMSNRKHKLHNCSLIGPCKRAELRPFYNRKRSSQYGCDSDTCEYKSQYTNKRQLCDCCPKSKRNVNCVCVSEMNRSKYPCDCESEEVYFNECVDEEIDDWLNQIPVPINESEVDIMIRQHAAKHLAEALKQLPDDNNFKEHAQEVIERWINNVSIWQPDTEQEKNKLKRLLMESLLDRITKIPRRPDKLTVIVKRFVGSMDLGDSHVNRKELTNNLTKRLKYLMTSPEDSDKYRDLLISEVMEIFKYSLPHMSNSGSEYLHKLATKLVEEIINSQSYIDIYAEETTSLKEDIMKNLFDWIDEITELSETPPNMREAKQVIEELATKLVDVQSGGTDTSTMKKMENEIQSSLKKLNISSRAMDNLIENVMDTITDTIYAIDKVKLETNNRREVFRDLNDWLKEKEEVSNLNPQEQYSVVIEMVDKIEKAKAEGHEDYQDIILENLAQNGNYINPDIHLDELVKKWKTFSARHKEKDLKDKIQKSVYAVIDKLNVPEHNKVYIKDKLSKELNKNITESSIATRKGIENINETLLEKIDEIVEELHIPKDMKDQLNETVNKNIEQLMTSKSKDAIMQTLTKEINYIISNEETPESEKKHLKYKLKQMLNEYSGIPFSNYVKDNIFENIDKIVNEEPIESTVKERLINKLIHVAQDKFYELPTQTVKNYVTEKTLKDIDLTIESAPLKENVKHDLKQMLKYILNENLKQPFSTEVKDVTLEQFHETINDLLMPDVTKNDLLKKMTNIVSQNLDELQCQTEIDHAKEIIMNDLNDLIDHFFLPKGQATQLKDGLRQILAEYLDRPYSNDLKDKLTVAVNKVITETPMDFDKKGELEFKVIDTINKRLDNLTFQSPEEFAKESILKDIMRMLNETSLSNSEKDDLKHKFEDIIEDCFPFDNLDTAKNVMGEGIRHIIYESSIPQSKQNELVDKMIDITDKILDESFYDDRVRKHLYGMFGMIENETPLPESHKDILKNELKAALDKYLQDPELLDIIEDSPSYEQIGQQEIDEANYNKIIKDAMNVIEEIPISINKKHVLENKMKNMAFDANRPKNFRQIFKELYKTIEEISIPWNFKKGLKSKLAELGPKNLQIKQLKHTLLKHIDSAIDLELLDEEQKSNLKNKFSEFVDLLDESLLSDKADTKVKDDMFRIIDENVLSRDQKRSLKDRIGNILTKISTKGQDEQNVKEKIMGYITEVIDEAPIRHHLKRNISSQLKRAISENFQQSLTRDTAVRLKYDFVNIIDEVPITDYQRDSLKRRLNHMLTRQLEQLPMNRDDPRELLLSDIDKILEDKSLPKSNKTALLHKLQKAVYINTDEPLSDDIKSKIQQNIADAIDEAIMPKEKKNKLKEELDAVVRKIFAMVSGNLKPADDLSTSLVRNICNVIKDAPISHENKKYLKKKIEESLPSRLQGVTSNDLEERVNNEMLNIINEVAVSPAQKKILKNFLANTVSQVIQEHQSKALKDEIKENTLRDVNIVIEKLNVPKEKKKQIKFKLKDLIDENFEKPFTVENSKIMKKGIYDIIAEAPLTKEKKAEIRHNLANIVDNNVKSLISVSSKPGTLMKSTKKPKRTLLNGIDSVLDPLPINVDDKVYIKQMLESVAEEVSEQSAEVIKDTIKIILDDTSIPKNKKTEVLDKLYTKIVDNLNTPYDKQMSFINENILEGLDTLLDELQVPSAQKKYLKNKFEDVVAEHLNESVSSNTMRVIKDNIYNIISEMPLSNNQKNLLSRKLFDLVKSNNTRDMRKSSITQQVLISLPKRTPATVYLSPGKKTSIIQEIDTVLDQLQSEHKRHLKPILKNLVQATLDAPLTSDTNEIIKKGISEIMVSAPIYPRDKKSEIKGILLDMVDNKIKPMIESSGEDTLMTSAGTSTANNLPRRIYLSPTKKDTAMRDIDTVFNQLQMSSGEKNNLKSKVKKVVNETFETPLSVDTSPIIKDKINKIIVESSNISADKKNMLKNELIDMVDNKITPLIESATIEPLNSMDERQRILSQALDHVLDKLQILNDEKKRVKSAVANIPQRPNTDISDNINAIVDDMTLPTNKKTEVKNKLHNLVKTATANIGKGSVSKNLNDNMYSPPRKDIIMSLKPSNENLIVTLNSSIDGLDTSKNLKSALKDVVQKNISKGDSLTFKTTSRLKSAISKAITDASISKEKKNDIESELINVIDEHVEGVPVTPTNEKIFNIKGTVLEDIESCLNSVQIPMDVKSNLKDKIRNKMAEYLETPQSTKKLENVRKDVNNIINEAPILENVKTQLRNNVRNKINRNTEYLPVTEALSFYNPSKTTAMRYEDTSNITKAWPSCSKSQQDSLPSGVIYDADDEDTKDQMSVAMSLLKAPKDYSSKKKKLKEDMLKDFSGIIDVINIPRNKKTDLKIKLNGIANSKIDKLFASPLRNSEMKRMIADNIQQVIDEASMGPAVTRQIKNDLKDQLLKVANKYIDTTIIDTKKSSGQSQMLLGTIEKLPIPSHIKDELKNKIMKSPEESVSSSQESRRLSPIRPRGSNISVIPEEGPVTSTPKKGRKSWERPVNSFSVIANEDVLQSLSPEERDYWMQIEESISKWLDELPIDLDEDTKAALKKEIANDIIDRLQYLQFNPGAKKSPQEELENLQYQVFRRLAKVLNREEMQLAIQAGDNLMHMMRDIKEPDKDAAFERTPEFEIHQQIKDIISTTLPELENASTGTLNSFEIMKDELADAFIKLHYTGGNKEELNKLKKKINDAIDKFCDDYLKKYPNKPLDREQLKRDLYNALKNVQPSDDLMKSVVEHVRFKDVVHDWVKKLPLKKQTTAERIQMNKNIALLSKKLLDLEQNDELSDSEKKDKMGTEIAKFLSTLPLKSGQEKNADKFKNDLIDQIYKTKATRTFDASTRHSITLDDFLGESSQWRPSFPPCTLSSEDIEHLERIKKRACMAPDCLASLFKKASENTRNASVNPMSIESGAQTEHYSENNSMPPRMPPCSSFFEPKVCTGQSLPYDQFCPMQFSGSPCTQSLSHMDVQPQIIIKEYYWNSTNTSEFPKSESRLSGGVQKRTCFASRPRCTQKYSQTCHDKALGSISCTPSPCAPPPCAPAPCSPTPCTPKFYTPKHCTTSALPQYYIPCHRINQQNSFSENNGSRKDDQYTEYSEAQITKSVRKEHVIELGSLDELRKPSQKERRFEEFTSCSRNPEQTVWEESRSSPDDSDEAEICINRSQPKERNVTCKCKAKPAATGTRGRWKQETPRNRAVLASNDSTSMKRCLKCCGMHCPYPSFMYFRQ